jgi:transcriptional antiterminator Rof (Rho-off)
MSKKVEVSVDFVKFAHASACNKWKGKIENEFPDLFEKTYKAGSTIRINSSEYLLVNVSGKAFLCRTDTGNVWSLTTMDYSHAYVTTNQLNMYVGYDKNWSIISRRED